MSELKFSRVNNEEYNTISINIENALTEMVEDDIIFLILNILNLDIER